MLKFITTAKLNSKMIVYIKKIKNTKKQRIVNG